MTNNASQPRGGRDPGQRLAIRVFVCAALGGSGPFSLGAEITNWSLNTGVTDSSGVEPIRDLRFSTTPNNPFQVAHETRIPGSGSPEHFSNSQFFVSWLVAESVGSFDVAFEQQINGPDSFANTSGTIYLHTDVDLLLNLSGSITFSSAAADEADFYCALSVRPPGPPPNQLWGGAIRGGTGSFGLPASGSGSFGRTDLLLPAGTTYTIRYTAETSMMILDQQPHQPLLASGTIHFDWRPMPEPAALLLSLAVIALGARRRPARRKTCRS